MILPPSNLTSKGSQTNTVLSDIPGTIAQLFAGSRSDIIEQRMTPQNDIYDMVRHGSINRKQLLNAFDRSLQDQSPLDIMFFL